MSDMFSDEPEAATPEDLCRQAFSRCSNWPEDRLGQIGLAQGLYRASGRFRITQEDLITRCRELSAFCPTDADLMRVAGEMFNARQAALAAKRNQNAEWERQYGKPHAFEGSRGKCSCCGRDWEEIMKTASDRRTEMWAKLRVHFEPKRGQWPSYRDMAPVVRDLGYEDYADAWERS